jgi:4-alpha-glucanotransferase
MNSEVAGPTQRAEDSGAPPVNLLDRRRAGVVCHVTSLPAVAGAGTLGDAALRFIDFLADSALSIWQVLPLNPPDPHGSPYQSTSLSACSAALADWAEIERAGGLAPWLAGREADYRAFRQAQAAWLDDFACFVVAGREYETAWWHWPAPLRDHAPEAVAAFATRHAGAIDEICVRQFVVFEQWQRVRRAAAGRGIVLLGDMPLYPALASADVWSNRAFFQLDPAGQPIAVAGVPPDYFSATGQRWGNPLYDWDAIARDGYRWWLARLRTQLGLFDVVRIDHFRGLEAYWSVPADALDAIGGHWRPAPGAALLDAVRAQFPAMPLVAEDLGIITPEVEALRDAYALPGMRVLQFAFSGDPRNPHLPEHYLPRTLAYTGTHDNDTTLGWYRSLDDRTRAEVDGYLGGAPEMPWSMIRKVFASSANSAIAPLQDYLGLDGNARMNTPGVAEGNWRWQCAADALTPALAGRIREAVQASGRAIVDPQIGLSAR